MFRRDRSKRRPHRSVGLGITVAVSVLAAVACSDTTQGAAEQGKWTPTKPVRIVVHASPGGSSDLMARTVASILSKDKSVGRPVTVENRPGGSGAVAYTYLRSQSGNPHVLATISGTYLGTPASGKADYCYKKNTNLAVFALDASMLVVSADSPYRTVKDLAQAARQSPGRVKFGGTQAGGADSVMHALLQEKTGTKLSYVSFGGGGEINAALLGRNVDVATGDPAELKGLIDAGKLRALAISTDQRIQGLDVPTFREQGVDLVFTQSRGLIAPQGINETEKSFWSDALSNMTKNPKWQKYLSDNLLVSEVQVGQRAEQYIAREWQKYVQIFRKLGFTPNPACSQAG